ncbi:SDR family oxidoreductase [Mycolicibacterium diernhoferi]|uniref:3-ketoacyl-ACP reductase n=1 Tax=Mycolicibacterium diernhoferi TaxID=1801 RepID=A0A1Q4H6M7_9MYCO|nr:SDR family oxidoreductase [Mycolicibacterium diernhoferi]OJZ63041.1 3-ketoacyl-ACP reductase [Mycolicibacterium diernhoferi]OPE54165.1 3-ketoacyl-ACP reductase [Mycolicibacterium diernhoferi]PEG53117.1 3-ketoacyl-ACP reductase [Mycolicibacterium diernhoferi]QYL22089.1 SDR family oxidoreductase [Mycolicibacterium diernhoferi]
MTTTRQIDRRVAIVLGGSGGIGRAVSERLAADGMAVVVHYKTGSSRATDTVQRITEAGGEATAIGGDVADEHDMAALFERTVARYGGIDVVVNTAGIMVLTPVADLDLADFDRMHRINVRGTVVVTQLAVRHLRSGGALVNFSTSITRLQTPNYAAYAASKGAVEAMTLVTAREMRGRDITVNTIAPGPTATPLFLADKSKELVDHIAGLSPMERIGSPADVAASVAALAGPARWVNGQIVFVNGGAV